MNEGEVERWIPKAGGVEQPSPVSVRHHERDELNEINDEDDEDVDDLHNPKEKPKFGSNESIKNNSNVNTPTSVTPRSGSIDHSNSEDMELMNNFIPLPPKLPIISSSESLLNTTPYNSNSPNINGSDDYVIYSDSEVGSQNSLDLSSPHKYIPSEDIDNSPTRAKSRRNKGSSNRRSSPRRGSSGKDSPRRLSPRRESNDSPTGKPKKRIRRKSTKSDGSEKSHPIGSGYASTPGAGKVFRNLLILEESLREQASQQKALRRKYLTFMAIMCSLIASIAHHLYFVDNGQTSKSPLRVVLTFVLLALLVTLLLYYLSGEYQKTIVLPRKFLSSTNRGLRQLNIRLVKIKTPLTDKLSDSIREFLLFIITSCLGILHKFDPTVENNKNSKLEVFLVSCQLQCQPRIGISDVKLVLNARVFSTDVREGWELYRSEFWVREGVRRRNDLMSFVTNNADDNILDKEKLLKRDKRERKDRKRSNTNPTPIHNSSSNSNGDGNDNGNGNGNNKLNDQNLNELANKLDDIDPTSRKTQ